MKEPTFLSYDRSPTICPTNAIRPRLWYRSHPPPTQLSTVKQKTQKSLAVTATRHHFTSLVLRHMYEIDTIQPSITSLEKSTQTKQLSRHNSLRSTLRTSRAAIASPPLMSSYNAGRGHIPCSSDTTMIVDHDNNDDG